MSPQPDLTKLETLAAGALANGWPANEVAAYIAKIVGPSGQNVAAPALSGDITTSSQAVRNAFKAVAFSNRR